MADASRPDRDARFRGLHGASGLCAASALALALAATAPAAAQAPPAAAKPVDRSKLRDPRVPAAIPNISGVWFPGRYNRRISPADGSETPWLPWTKEAFDTREAAEKAGSPLFDPTAACLPSGQPRLNASPYPIEIIQTPDVTVLMHETHHLFRLIYMNQEHPKNLKPSYLGHSVGRWEGDTLVVDTVALLPHTQIDEAGTLHSDALHLVERFRKTSDNELEVVFTIDDPKAFSRPWDARRTYRFEPGGRFIEYVCEENNRNAPDATGVLRKF